MNISDIPAWFAKRFAADATGTYVRSIPTTSADPTAASLSLGFPPDTFADIGAGGTPPDGRDFNGILNQLSAWGQWAGVGGAVPWSSTISAAAGGYPLGAIVLSNTVTGRLYQSQVNANVTNPDTGGAGWAILVNKAASPADIAAGTSNELVVTPSGLAASGADRVIAQSLVANGGFRVFASGFKECWGSTTVGATSTAGVTLPTAHSSWFTVSIAARTQTSVDFNAGVSAWNGVSGFTLRNNQTSGARVDWHTRGV